jgi:hypothetical protein
MTFGTKTLVRESDWMRVFKVGEETYLYESKFLVDDLRVSPHAIRDRWPSLSLDEKAEFASAFGSQPPRDNDDQQILEFLMGAGPKEVWRGIATLVPFHANSDRALDFLLEKADQEAPGMRANYYQAFELLRKTEAVTLLRKQYDDYRNLIANRSTRRDQLDVWIDYLQCSKTLWALTHDSIFLTALKEAEASAPAEIRPSLEFLLGEAEKN